MLRGVSTPPGVIFIVRCAVRFHITKMKIRCKLSAPQYTRIKSVSFPSNGEVGMYVGLVVVTALDGFQVIRSR
jgi:hypothetical protein